MTTSWLTVTSRFGSKPKTNIVQKLFTLSEITVVILTSQEVIKAEELPDEENEIILNQVFHLFHYYALYV